MIQNLGGRIVNNWLYRYADGYVLIDTGYENGYQTFLQTTQKERHCTAGHSLLVSDTRPR